MTKKPDYTSWSKYDGIPLWIAIRLLYDQDPENAREFNQDEYDSYTYKSNKDQFDEETELEQYELYKLGITAIKMNTLPSCNGLITIRDFYEWASKKGFPKDKEVLSEKLLKIVEKENIEYSTSITDPQTIDNVEFKFSQNSSKTWDFIFEGNSCPPINELRGFFYIQEVLRKPNAFIPCSKLIEPFSGSKNVHQHIDKNDPSFASAQEYPDNQPHLTENFSKKAFDKISDLERKIEKCKEIKDHEKRAILEKKLEYLEDKISCTGKNHFNNRSQESINERKSRGAVYKAIKDAITRISEYCPELGNHLKKCINTGKDITYRPQKEIDWNF